MSALDANYCHTMNQIKYMKLQIKAAFNDHPESVGETYCEHLQVALSFSLQLFFACLACLAHAFFPFILKQSGSAIIRDLNIKMLSDRCTKETAFGIDKNKDREK